MTRASRARTATLDQVLVFYDQPHVVCLNGDRGYRMLAVAVEERGRMAMPFLACEVSDRLFDAYVSGGVDLNFALRQGKRNRYAFFDWAASEDGEAFVLSKASLAEIENDLFYPEVGFFSEFHTHHYQSLSYKHPGRLVYNIAGKWDAADFSRFVGRVDEIYSFARVLDEGYDLGGALTDYHLEDAITPRQWVHGGDYTQFYRGLKGSAPGGRALRVERIAYNSPGQVVVRGEQEALREVADIIESYRKNREETDLRYQGLRSILLKEGLLSRSTRPDAPTDGLKKFVSNQTNILLRDVGIENSSKLFDACHADAVVFAKVVLSFIRRVKDIARFYAEGRVSNDKFAKSIAVDKIPDEN